MNCSWKVYFTPKDNRSVLQIVRNAGFNYTEGLWSQMTIYNCNEACEAAYQETPNISTCFNYVQKDAYTETMFTQEKEICINFTSFGKACVDCWWELQLQMIEVEQWETSSFDTNHTFHVIDSWQNHTAYTFHADNPTRLFVAFDGWDVDHRPLGSNLFYIYLASGLTNYLTYNTYEGLVYGQDYPFIGDITIFYVGALNQTDAGYVSFYFRSVEEAENNCNASSGTDLVFVSDTSEVMVNGIGKDPCMFYVIGTRGIMGYNFVPTLQIATLNYTGNSTLQVASGYNNSYVLFDSDQESDNGNKMILYGNLIVFIVPPQSQLYLELCTKDYSDNEAHAFDNWGSGMFMSPTYPSGVSLGKYINEGHTTLRSMLSSSLGWFAINVTIEYANVPNSTILSLQCSTTGQSFYNQTIVNLTMQFSNCTEMNIDFTILSGASSSELWDGYLISFNAVQKDIETPKPNHLLWIILGSIGAFIIAVIIMVIILVFYIRKREKHFVQLYDILKEMYLTPEDLESLKRSTDEFLIDSKKLEIDFVKPIGNGYTSNVYKAKLNGPSPLHLMMKMLETQRFCDCEVAVKMASDFGQNEAENLFKEIKAMKEIGYHEHIISMLGWCKYNEKPCLVFELAQTDLLKYVRAIKANGDPVSIRTFLSILWQVADGMQYIASKGLIHRDLAARNILLCENFAAKISDFGLCCSHGDAFIYQASLLKKLPMKWLALEALQTRTFSEKSDVWAFGILMYEVFSLGKVPYETMNNVDMLEFLEEGRRLEMPESANELHYDLMKECWMDRPDSRPNFGDIVQKLRDILEQQTESYGYLLK